MGLVRPYKNLFLSYFWQPQRVFLALLQCILVNFFIFFESVNLPLSALEITTLMLEFEETSKIKLGSLFLILVSSMLIRYKIIFWEQTLGQRGCFH